MFCKIPPVAPTGVAAQLRPRPFAGTLARDSSAMSQLLIQQYLNQLATLKKVSGSTRESVVREAFKDLLKGWARSHDLVFVPEYEIETKTKERRYVDGALLYELRVPFGYWEAKDEKDDLEAEIEYKFKRGYTTMKMREFEPKSST